MKNKIILYENQRLYAESMLCLLERNAYAKKYEIQAVTELEELEKNIVDPDSILFLNIVGFATAEVPDYIEKFLQLNSSLRVIISSLYPEPRMIKKFFDKGIKGYLGSNTSSEEFLQALQDVTAGKVYVNEDAKNALFNFICSVEDPSVKKPAAPEELTSRERDVLNLICDGLRSKEIAEKLFISTHTVESHRRNMMLKFNINSSNRLVKFAFENRLVEY